MALTIKQEAFYVYHLIDPRNGKVFYVGKGSGNRVAHHERDAKKLRFANSPKEALIHEIWMDGLEVERRIVQRFDVEAEAYVFEKQEIARIGLWNLTNLSKGGEPDALKAKRRAQQFVRILGKKLTTLSGAKREQAEGLLEEMAENIRACDKALAM